MGGRLPQIRVEDQRVGAQDPLGQPEYCLRRVQLDAGEVPSQAESSGNSGALARADLTFDFQPGRPTGIEPALPEEWREVGYVKVAHQLKAWAVQKRLEPGVERNAVGFGDELPEKAELPLVQGRVDIAVPKRPLIHH